MKGKTSKYVSLVIAVIVIAGMVSLIRKSQGAQGQHGLPVIEESTVLQDVPAGWEPLFDGKTLSGWEIVRYGGEGEPYVRNGVIVLPMAVSGLMTGICWVGDPLPTNNYIIYYEARRREGHDIFAALSFPYGDTFASLIFGGWGGIVNGLSSINGYDASENETTRHFILADNEWYQVQLRVTTDTIRAIVGAEQVIDMVTTGKDIHLRPGLSNTGLTLWSYLTTGEIRNLRIKKLD